jgi:hypothetical protein
MKKPKTKMNSTTTLKRKTYKKAMMKKSIDSKIPPLCKKTNHP